MALLALATSACSLASDRANGTATSTSATATSWSADDPPSDWASGLTIGAVPPGFTFGWSEGHETATFHVFVSGDGLTQFSVGRQTSLELYPVTGHQVIRDGRVFTVNGEIRIFEDAGHGVRIEVLSRSLDEEALLAIAESVEYDPAQDR